MIRGTTPTLTLTTDVDLSNAEVLYVTFQQCGVDIFEKTKDEVKIDGMTCEITLTQEDTLALSPRYPCYVQIRGRNPDGVAFATYPPEEIDVGEILKDGVI